METPTKAEIEIFSTLPQATSEILLGFSIQDIRIIIFSYLTSDELVALSETNKKNRNMFNEVIMLNTFKEQYKYRLLSTSFNNGEIFLNDLCLLIECD